MSMTPLPARDFSAPALPPLKKINADDEQNKQNHCSGDTKAHENQQIEPSPGHAQVIRQKLLRWRRRLLCEQIALDRRFGSLGHRLGGFRRLGCGQLIVVEVHWSGLRVQLARRASVALEPLRARANA